jgi:hypothetical protein
VRSGTNSLDRRHTIVLLKKYLVHKLHDKISNREEKKKAKEKAEQMNG